MSARPGGAGTIVTALVASFGVVLALGLLFGTSTASPGPKPGPTPTVTSTRSPSPSPHRKQKEIDVTFERLHVGEPVEVDGVLAARQADGTVCLTLPGPGWTVPDPNWQLAGRVACRTLSPKPETVRVHLTAHK